MTDYRAPFNQEDAKEVSDPRDTLREQVAQAIHESDRGPRDGDWLSLDSAERLEYALNADAAIRVVLAAVIEQLEALHPPRDEMQPSGWTHGKRDVLLAVVARLFFDRPPPDAAELAERAEWDVTLMDGIESESFDQKDSAEGADAR